MWLPSNDMGKCSQIILREKSMYRAMPKKKILSSFEYKSCVHTDTLLTELTYVKYIYMRKRIQCHVGICMYRSLGEVWDAYILADTATIEPGPEGYSELIED